LQLQRLLVAERRPRGLQEPVDGARSGGATFGDLLADPAAEEAFEELPMNIGAAEVPDLLAHLSVRERNVVESRYGLCGPERTLRQLGQTMGVSAERVRQIEQTALEKMRVCASARRAGQGGTGQQRLASVRRRTHDRKRDGARQIAASAQRR
jgi:DNA-directed RNA polymerase sigma subunit (sigma70/sigma32)